MDRRKPLFPPFGSDKKSRPNYQYSEWDATLCGWRFCYDIDSEFWLKIGSHFRGGHELEDLVKSVYKREVQWICEQSNFFAIIDVVHFKPYEIIIKSDAVKEVTVCCKHKERMDNHGFISREFTRTFKIPETSDIRQVQHKLLFDGLLIITIPKLRWLADIYNFSTGINSGYQAPGNTSSGAGRQSIRSGEALGRENINPAVKKSSGGAEESVTCKDDAPVSGGTESKKASKDKKRSENKENKLEDLERILDNIKQHIEDINEGASSAAEEYLSKEVITVKNIFQKGTVLHKIMKEKLAELAEHEIFKIKPKVYAFGKVQYPKICIVEDDSDEEDDASASESPGSEPAAKVEDVSATPESSPNETEICSGNVENTAEDAPYLEEVASGGREESTKTTEGVPGDEKVGSAVQEDIDERIFKTGTVFYEYNPMKGISARQLLAALGEPLEFPFLPTESKSSAKTTEVSCSENVEDTKPDKASSSESKTCSGNVENKEEMPGAEKDGSETTENKENVCAKDNEPSPNKAKRRSGGVLEEIVDNINEEDMEKGKSE